MKQIYLIFCMRVSGELRVYQNAYTDFYSASKALRELREQKTLGEGIYYYSEINLIED